MPPKRTNFHSGIRTYYRVISAIIRQGKSGAFKVWILPISSSKVGGVPTWDDYPPIMDTADVAELLHLNVEVVRRKARTGEIPARRMPGVRTSYLFDRDELRAWWESLRSEQERKESPSETR